LGALTGSVFGIILVQASIISSYYLSNIVVISMAAFFTASVQSPVTGTILIMEMTSSYEHLLVLCTASMIALVVAQVCHGQPIYEALLNKALSKKKVIVPPSEQRNIIELTVASGSAVDGKYIGRVHWPAHVVLIDIKRGSSELIPDIDTSLHAGDYLYILTDSIEGAEAVRNLVEREKP
jgi:Trk K+ transport system NAD-binding subunit